MNCSVITRNEVMIPDDLNPYLNPEPYGELFPVTNSDSGNNFIAIKS